MVKRDTLRLSQHQFITTGADHNGRYWIAYSSGASVFVRSHVELRRFLKIPKSIPMRAALESWLENLRATDAERNEPSRDELIATGFGPECHLDESDPNYQTRAIT